MLVNYERFVKLMYYIVKVIVLMKFFLLSFVIVVVRIVLIECDIYLV